MNRRSSRARRGDGCRWGLVGLFGAVGLLATASASSAAEAPAQAEDATLSWSVRPTPRVGAEDRPNYALELNPGEAVSDSIRVRNYSTEPLQLDVYASDAITTSSGALDLLPAGERSTDVGVWVELEADHVVIAADEFVDVPFTLTVPADAEPGDHTGGIVTSHQSRGTDDDGQPVVLDRRLGSRVHVRVGGELRPQLAISELSASYSATLNPIGTGTVHVGYTVTNTGNVRLGAEQAITTPGRFGSPGRRVAGEPIAELLPGSSQAFAVDVHDVWPTARTAVDVELTLVPTRDGDVFGPTEPTVASTSLWTVPWTLLAVLVTLIATPMLWRRRRRRQRRRQAALVQRAVDEALAERAPEYATAAPCDPEASVGTGRPG